MCDDDGIEKSGEKIKKERFPGESLQKNSTREGNRWEVGRAFSLYFVLPPGETQFFNGFWLNKRGRGEKSIGGENSEGVTVVTEDKAVPPPTTYQWKVWTSTFANSRARLRVKHYCSQEAFHRTTPTLFSDNRVGVPTHYCNVSYIWLSSPHLSLLFASFCTKYIRY